MTEIYTNKIHKDSIKVNPNKDMNSKVKLNDYLEGVLNTLTKLVGKTHISYFVCMGIKKKQKSKKKKEIKKNTKDKKNIQKIKKDKKNTQKNKKDKKILKTTKTTKKTKKIKNKKKIQN